MERKTVRRACRSSRDGQPCTGHHLLPEPRICSATSQNIHTVVLYLQSPKAVGSLPTIILLEPLVVLLLLAVPLHLLVLHLHLRLMLIDALAAAVVAPPPVGGAGLLTLWSAVVSAAPAGIRCCLPQPVQLMKKRCRQ